MDGQQIFYSTQHLLNDNYEGMNGGMNQQDEFFMDKNEAELKFMHFILEIQVKNVYIYRE